VNLFLLMQFVDAKGGRDEIIACKDRWWPDSGWDDIRNMAVSRLWGKR
jgi:hypothetical protein